MRKCATTVIPEAHVGIVPRWLRLCTWWSCEACSRRCSCRTSPGAPSPKRHLRQQLMPSWRNPHHSWEILDDLLPMLLDAHSGRIPGQDGCFYWTGNDDEPTDKQGNKPARVSVLASHNCSNARLSIVPNRRVGHICSKENHLRKERCDTKITEQDTGGWFVDLLNLLTGSLKTFGLMDGTRMEFTPPSFTLIWI